MHKKPLKIFVCEFITAGGFNHADLPTALVREGAMMRDALLRDLSDLPYEIYTTVDARLARPAQAVSVIEVRKDDDVWAVWQTQIQLADAVWLIAPETDGLLKKLTQLAVIQGKTMIGCGLESIEISTSKLATSQALQRENIRTIPTFTIEHEPSTAGAWIVKPDDGAGCDETYYFENAESLLSWKNSRVLASKLIVQPFQSGVAASISCVMRAGKAYILSCNTQRVKIRGNQLKFSGIIVNGMCAHWASFEALANRIAQALPDLAGYVGVDVIVEDDQIIVVEINPRLTTSYCALAEATGANPAALIINSLMQENFDWPAIQQKVVTLHV